MSSWPTDAGTVFFSQGHRQATLSAAVKSGRIARLYRGLYTADLRTPAERLVHNNRYAIVAHFIPDAVITDRSGGAVPVVDGHLFVASEQRTTDLSLPGLTIKVRSGGPATDDLPWHGVRKASLARCVLDNLARSRARSGPARTFSLEELTDWLADRANINGPAVLDRISEQVPAVARQLGHSQDQVAEAMGLIEGVAGRAPLPSGSGRAAIALAGGADPDRVRMFKVLADHLDGLSEIALPEPPADARTLAFYEAYFSNFIEGTEFTLDEAELIVSGQKDAVERPEDAHDVLATFQLVADPVGRATVPNSPQQLLELLTARHATLMAARPSKRPGKVKTVDNRAGNWTFVSHGRVLGTLAAGWEAIEATRPGWHRALMTMFVITEVHPFDDGNGRIARVMMNAELSAAAQSRIIVPTIWRDEYLANLRAMSRDGNADRYVRAMNVAWRWTAAMNWTDQLDVRGQLEATNAMVPSREADELGLTLGLPA